jgi:hypothetical protein
VKEVLIEKLKHNVYSSDNIRNDLDGLMKNSNGWLKTWKGWIKKNSTMDENNDIKLF